MWMNQFIICHYWSIHDDHQDLAIENDNDNLQAERMMGQNHDRTIFRIYRE